MFLAPYPDLPLQDVIGALKTLHNVALVEGEIGGQIGVLLDGLLKIGQNVVGMNTVQQRNNNEGSTYITPDTGKENGTSFRL